MLYVSPEGRVVASNTPEEVPLVPSKREAMKALAIVLSVLDEEQCDRLKREIETTQRFVWSR